MDLARAIGRKPLRPGPVYDATVPKLLDQCLQKTGTPAKWDSLLKDTLVDGKSLPQSIKPPTDCFWELGHYFQKFDDHILWHGLTVDGDEHCYNHTARIYPNGKIVGSVNCFRLGECPIQAEYVKGHLEEWLGRIKGAPYWDEIDGEPV